MTFNKEYSHIFYQENTYALGDDYDATDKVAAFAKTMEWGAKQIPTGILYQVEEPSYESQIPQLKKRSSVATAVKKRDISKVLKKYL